MVAEAAQSPAEFHAASGFAYDAAVATLLLAGPVRIPAVPFSDEGFAVLADRQVVDGHRAEVVEGEIELRAGGGIDIPHLRDAGAAILAEHDSLVDVADFLGGKCGSDQE